jgi:dTDP-4-amino-4,6-dideoxygalactose transaminase
MNINIVKPFLPALNEVADEFTKMLQTGLVTNNSQYVRLFEEKLQAYLGSAIKPTVYCNGEMGLYHLIQAWKIKMGYGPHDSFEVLVPSFTFSGTINAVVMNNLKPVFCDVDETLTLDVKKLAVNSPDVKMIVAVGAYGNLTNLDELGKFANDNKLVLILDNAPAFGSKFKNKFPCHYGYSEMISFHATKIFNSMEGGANIVNDQEIQDYLVRLRDFGQYEKTRGDVDMPGLNSKMQEISALIGLKNLEKVDFILNSRFSNIAKYQQFFTSLESQGHLKTMVVHKDILCTYLYYPIVLNEEATRFVEYMQANNIAVIRYYTATHELKFYKDRYRQNNLDFTNAIKDRIVSLPLHTIMTQEEFDHLFNTIQQYFTKQA